jgi:hypothetical protein
MTSNLRLEIKVHQKKLVAAIKQNPVIFLVSQPYYGGSSGIFFFFFFFHTVITTAAAVPALAGRSRP